MKKPDPSVLGSNIKLIDAEALAAALNQPEAEGPAAIDPAVLAAAIAYVRKEMAAKVEVVAAPQTKQRYRKIILDPHDDIPTNGGLYVGYNGRQFMLPTNRAILVPQGVIDVLNDAVTAVPVRDPETMKLIGSRPQRRFQYAFTPDDPGADHIWAAEMRAA